MGFVAISNTHLTLVSTDVGWFSTFQTKGGVGEGRVYGPLVHKSQKTRTIGFDPMNCVFGGNLIECKIS